MHKILSGNIGDAKSLMEERAIAYEFLSTVFRSEVTEVFLENLSGFEAAEGSVMASYVEYLKSSDVRDAAQDLRCEFARLFLGMCANPIAAYESVFLSPNQCMMQDERDEVLAEYRKHGFAVVEDFKLPEDHASVEFSFMAALSRQVSAALDAGDYERAGLLIEAQGSFLDEHLGKWIPLLAERVINESRSDFYRGVAEMARDMLAEDAELLS